jgi:opacity protein-like surface antigen
MNNRLLTIAAGVIVLLNASAFAQIGVQPGITAGLSSYSEKVSTSGISVTNDSKAGLAFGGVLDIAIMNMFSIEPGVIFSMRGGQSSSYGITLKEYLTYLALPLHFKLKYPVTPIVSPYALAGLNLGILLSAKDDDGTNSVDIKNSLNTTDFGIDLGAGVEFSVSSAVPFAEFVYNLGLSNIYKNAPADFSLKTNGMEIKVGLRFKM